MQRNYTGVDVVRYRDENSCSLQDAKAHLEKQFFLEAIHIAHENKDFDLLCDVVRELVNLKRF